MKALNRKAVLIKRYTSGFALLVILIAMAISFTGCGKKKGAPPPPLAPPTPQVVCPGPGCPSGGGGNYFVTAAVGFNLDSSAAPRMELALDFYTDGNSSAGAPVFAYGYLRVHRRDYTNQCLPEGTYRLRPYQGQPGQLFNANHSVAQVVLEGDNGIIIQLQNNYFVDEAPPVVGSDGKTYPRSLWNPMFITAQSCGGATGAFQLERLVTY